MWKDIVVSNPKNSKPRSHAKKFAEIENLSIAGITARLSPVGLWVYGKHYANAASAVLEPEAPYEPVRYYLACHAIELFLKAYLSTKGSSLLAMAESRFGHNLDSILAEAEAQGLNDLVPLPTHQKEEVLKVSYYYAGKVFEYPAMGEAIVAYPRLPDLSVLLQAAQTLLQGLDIPCKDAS